MKNQKFYIRSREPQNKFFVMDETLEAALGACALAIAGFCLLLLLA